MALFRGTQIWKQLTTTRLVASNKPLSPSFKSFLSQWPPPDPRPTVWRSTLLDQDWLSPWLWDIGCNPKRHVPRGKTHRTQWGLHLSRYGYDCAPNAPCWMDHKNEPLIKPNPLECIHSHPSITFFLLCCFLSFIFRLLIIDLRSPFIVCWENLCRSAFNICFFSTNYLGNRPVFVFYSSPFASQRCVFHLPSFIALPTSYPLIRFASRALVAHQFHFGFHSSEYSSTISPSGCTISTLWVPSRLLGSDLIPTRCKVTHFASWDCTKRYGAFTQQQQ